MLPSPAVSIIIPCRNEIAFVDGCLRSVFAFAAVPGGFEVLVVDGGSDDGTRERLAAWASTHPTLRVLDNPARIVPTAMNIGIRAARGRLILRLDMHAEYPADYMRQCVETSNRTGAANVGGVVDVATLPGAQLRQAQLVQALTTHRFGVGNSGFRLDAAEGSADTVPYGCFQRAVFDTVGWYDERLVRNQDYELNRRILTAGYQIWLNPRIRVRYYNQRSLRGLLRQAIVTAQWNPWMWDVAPYTFVPRHALPGVFVAGLTFAAGLTRIPRLSGLGKALLVLALVPYTMLAMRAAWQQARRYGWWMLPLLPWLFFAYHVTYGVGIIRGISDLILGRAPVQIQPEPWQGAGSRRIPVPPTLIRHTSPQAI